jgi:hypothetical protein
MLGSGGFRSARDIAAINRQSPVAPVCLWLRPHAAEQAFWNKTFKMPDMELVNQTRRVWYRGRYYASGYACSTLSGGLIINDIEDRLLDLCIAEGNRSPRAPRRLPVIISVPKDPCCF